MVCGRISVSGGSHHIDVIGNYVHDCGGGGIGQSHTDYVMVSDNWIHDTSLYADNQESCLSVWQPKHADQASRNDAGYHHVFQRNRCWDNRNTVPSPAGYLTDGNG